MKLLHDEKAGNGKDRFVFHIGTDEIKVLMELLAKAINLTATTGGFGPIRNRMTALHREFIKAMNFHHRVARETKLATDTLQSVDDAYNQRKSKDKPMDHESLTINLERMKLWASVYASNAAPNPNIGGISPAHIADQAIKELDERFCKPKE